MFKQQLSTVRETEKAIELKNPLEANATWNKERGDAVSKDGSSVVVLRDQTNPEFKILFCSWWKNFLEK